MYPSYTGRVLKHLVKHSEAAAAMFQVGYPWEIPDCAFRLVFAGSVLSDESTIQSEGIEPYAALYAEVDPAALVAAQEAAKAAKV